MSGAAAAAVKRRRNVTERPKAGAAGLAAARARAGVTRLAHTAGGPARWDGENGWSRPAAKRIDPPATRAAGWRPKTCQWIDGDARERAFCGAPVQPGSSYCAAHHARCWRPATAAERRAIKEGR